MELVWSRSKEKGRRKEQKKGKRKKGRKKKQKAEKLVRFTSIWTEI